MNFNARIKARVAGFDRWARPWAQRGRWHGYAYEFLVSIVHRPSAAQPAQATLPAPLDG